MRTLFLPLIPFALGLFGCGPEGPYRTVPDPQRHAPPAAQPGGPPPGPNAELSDEEMDEIDEIVDSILEEELQNP